MVLIEISDKTAKCKCDFCNSDYVTTYYLVRKFNKR